MPAYEHFRVMLSRPDPSGARDLTGLPVDRLRTRLRIRPCYLEDVGNNLGRVLLTVNERIDYVYDEKSQMIVWYPGTGIVEEAKYFTWLPRRQLELELESA
jgi:hypothetical protein